MPFSGHSVCNAHGGRALFVEPDVLEAPAVIGAVDHDVQPLDLGPPAGRLAQVEWPHNRLLQLAVDLPNELLALRLVGFHRLLVDHLLDLGIAVMCVVAVRLAAVVLIEGLVGIVDAGTRHTLSSRSSFSSGSAPLHMAVSRSNENSRPITEAICRS